MQPTTETTTEAQLRAAIERLEANPPPAENDPIPETWEPPAIRDGETYAQHDQRVKRAREQHEGTRRTREAAVRELRRKQLRAHAAEVAKTRARLAAAIEANGWREGYAAALDQLVAAVPSLAPQRRELLDELAECDARAGAIERGLDAYREQQVELGPEPAEPDVEDVDPLALADEFAAHAEQHEQWHTRARSIARSVDHLTEDARSVASKRKHVEARLAALERAAADALAGAALANVVGATVLSEAYLVMLRSLWAQLEHPSVVALPGLHGGGLLKVLGDRVVIEVALPSVRPSIAPEIERVLAGDGTSGNAADEGEARS